MSAVVNGKTAAEWLDKACQYEREGSQQKADLAFKQALKADESEEVKSLPRK